ncbi:MAG: YdeI/OmpD-associated family protein [Ignavibacteria bacterium]|nr:YdeI/OmpD-associated family protein [Ignavibacteria bacterium]
MADKNTRVRFFKTPAEFRAWLRVNHRTETELVVGYFKKGTGKKSITWPESVDQALCYGWIDGVRRSLDLARYTVRFTPRKPGSHWSAVNIARVQVLRKHGLMRSAGEKAFAKRTDARSRLASYEQASVDPHKKLLGKLRAQRNASAYFLRQPPSYQKQCLWWVQSAKKEETRERRLKILINSCANSEMIPPLKWTQKRQKKG